MNNGYESLNLKEIETTTEKNRIKLKSRKNFTSYQDKKIDTESYIIELIFFFIIFHFIIYIHSCQYYPIFI